MPSGYERGEDPFVYHNGGTRAIVTSMHGSEEGSLNRSVEFERQINQDEMTIKQNEPAFGQEGAGTPQSGVKFGVVLNSVTDKKSKETNRTNEEEAKKSSKKSGVASGTGDDDESDSSSGSSSGSSNSGSSEASSSGETETANLENKHDDSATESVEKGTKDGKSSDKKMVLKGTDNT